MKVSFFQTAVVFKQNNDIVFTVGERLKALQQEYNANLQLLNIPQAAPPEAPRVLLISPVFSINIALNRLDIMLNIPDQIKKNQDSAFGLLSGIVEKVNKMLINDYCHYEWCGVIANLEFPNQSSQKPSVKIIEGIFGDLVSINRKNRELASFSLQYGFKEHGFFKNTTISGYDLYNLKLHPAVSQQEINLDKEQIFESGVSINIDINNRPSAEKGTFLHDFQQITEELKISIGEALYECNLAGRIK